MGYGRRRELHILFCGNNNDEVKPRGLGVTGMRFHTRIHEKRLTCTDEEFESGQLGRLRITFKRSLRTDVFNMEVVELVMTKEGDDVWV